MAVAVRASSQAILKTAGTTTGTIAVPTGTTSGDFMVCVVFAELDSVKASVTVAGHTLQGSWVSPAPADTAMPIIGVFTKTAGGSEGSTYAIAGDTNTGSFAYTEMAISGSANAIEVGPTGSTNTTTGTAIVAPTVSPVNAASLLICGFAQETATATTYTTPASMTLVQSFVTTASYTRGLVASQVLAAAGATGTRTSTSSGTLRWSAVSFTVAPAGAARLPRPRVVGQAVNRAAYF